MKPVGMVGGTLDVLVIGGGPAGATAAARLAGLGFSVVLLEKRVRSGPKVCGEVLSPEGVGFLRGIGWVPDAGVPIRVVRLYWGDRCVTGRLEPPAWGLSRRVLDESLLDRAVRSGARVLRGYEAVAVHRRADVFLVRARRVADGAEAEFPVRHVVGAFGIKSGAVVPLSGLEERPGEVVAFATHLRGPVVEGQVELYFSDHGYVGLAGVEGGRVNLCGIVERAFFRRLSRGVEGLLDYWAERSRPFRERLDAVSEQEPYVGTVLLQGFGVGRRVWEGVALVGDRAGAVHPFCGDGIARAVQSGLLWADSLARGRAEGWSSAGVLRHYDRGWRRALGPGLRMSRWLEGIRRWSPGFSALWGLMERYPWVLARLIEETRVRHA